MAKKVITLLTDDLDGSEAELTVNFAFDGSNYTIDLNEANAKEFRETMQRYTSAATRTGRHVPLPDSVARYTPGGTLRQVTRAKGVQSRAENTAIREWAASNGYELADRGRIPQEVVNAYNTRAAAAPAPAEPAAAPARTRTRRTATKG